MSRNATMNEAAAIFYENSTTGIDKSIPKGRLKR